MLGGWHPAPNQNLYPGASIPRHSHTHVHSPGVPIETVQAQGSEVTLQCTQPFIKICLSLNQLLCPVSDLSN